MTVYDVSSWVVGLLRCLALVLTLHKLVTLHELRFQVGAVIVSLDNIILSIGYNGFPRGCPDEELPWAKKSRSGNVLDTKYPYVSHTGRPAATRPPVFKRLPVTCECLVSRQAEARSFTTNAGGPR